MHSQMLGAVFSPSSRPAAKRMTARSQLIATGKASNCLIGDKAYDSAELRLWLKDRGTKPVIPNRATESSRSALKCASTKNDAASRTPSAD
jgi:hypothetical protein